MTDSRACAFCCSEITIHTDSNEHIIPNSIGGRRKIRGFLCVKCNNSLGQSWDRTLAGQLNWFALALNIKRERGNAPDAVVRTVDGAELLLRGDGTMTRNEPFFEQVQSGDHVNIRMFARTEVEAKRMMVGIKKKYPQFDLEGELKRLKIAPYRLESRLQHQLEVGGSDAGRSVVKTAVAECLARGIAVDKCDAALYTLQTPTDDSGFALFYLRDIVRNRPEHNLFHLIAVRGDPESQTLVAYVEYFGVMRFLVSLSKQYEGEGFTSSYAIDPQTGEELDLAVDWRIPAEDLDAAFRGHGVLQGRFDHACKSATDIAAGIRVRRERCHVYREEITAVLSELGYPPGTVPEEKDRDRFDELMTEKLGPLSEWMGKIPPMPDL